MPDIDVELAERRYRIHIAQNSLQAEIPLAISGKVLIVTDAHVGPLYAARLQQAIGRRDCPIWQMPAGEAEKNLSRFSELLNAMAEFGIGRDGALIALGGGVVGDLTGFAAACYMRGIAFIQVPTSLLAMVDSSVGGKTAVDLPAGKNLVGAFHQPKAVWIDTTVLQTLPAREFKTGLAEVVKYGAIADADFFNWLEIHASNILAHDQAAMAHLIGHCCAQKAGVVARDETEQGERALLNFGHTFGHALEVLLDYSHLLHGEAVAIGMVLAARYSAHLGLAPATDAERLCTLLQSFGLPVAIPPGLDVQAILAKMALDKKSVNGQLRLILWRGIGKAYIEDNVDAERLHAFLEA